MAKSLRRLESSLEDYAHKKFEENNIVSIKLGFEGWPDRLLISQISGNVYFAEFKRDVNSKLRLLQKLRFIVLYKCFKHSKNRVLKVDSKEKVKEIIHVIHS